MTALPQRGRPVPERLVLDVRPGHARSPEPPVRIFLGTEASQFRPERVLVWSIEQVRDPARVYEIHLMKELEGFDRRGWTTGFTNYRFAIPHFAGGTGRAIYNDEDQIYRSDPAALFDLDMGEFGFLAISETESSVMLIDCARMAEVWTLAGARAGSKKALLKRAVEAGLLGPLDPHWNARDEEYAEGRSHLLHYSTLHTQPWRPFPERFVYQRQRDADLWHDLERSADAAGFQLFTRERPSARYHALRRGRRDETHGAPEPRDEADLRALVSRAGEGPVSAWDALGRAAPTVADGVVATGLAGLPEDDVPWALDAVFGAARRFVFAAVDCGADAAEAKPDDPCAAALYTPAARWPAHFEAVSTRLPGVHWQLLLRGRDVRGRVWEERHRGGRFLGEVPPQVWLICDDRRENLEPALALAEALGWPWERRLLSRPVQGPPWPDLVIAAGEGAAEAARRLRRRARGRVWVVLVGSEAGGRCAGVDLVVTSAASGFFPDPRRHVTALPLVRCDPSRLREAAEPWRKHFDESSAPRIGLLVDGARLSPASARALGEAVARRARSRGGRVFPCASDRTPRPVLAALESGLGVSAHVEARDGAFAERGDAYLAHLALADEFVVADDDERVVADACSRARPVSLWPLPPSPRGPGELLRAGVAHMARAPRANNRGTVRPQQGLERFCSRLIQGQWLRPPRDPLAALAAAASLGAVERLDGSEPGVDFRPLADAERAAGRVRRLLGID